MASPIVTGTYEGTGAAINIDLGFQPSMLIIVNTEDGDAAWMWFDTMASGTAQALGTLASVGSNGVTPLEGTLAGQKEGFTVGTALSENGKTFAYCALRSNSY